MSGRVLAKFCAFLLIGAIGSAVLLYVAWNSRGATKLAAARAQIKAAGQPITGADLMQAPVPDDRNAALLLRSAAKEIDEQTEAWKAYDKLEWPSREWLPLDESHRRVLQGAIDENQAAFPLVDSATKRDSFDWKIDYTVNYVQLHLPDLYEQRKLAELLKAAALLAHEAGSDAHAFRCANHMGFQSRAVATQPTLVSSLVATGIEALRASILMGMAPEIRISSDARGVSKEQLREVIAELLDNRPLEMIRGGLIGDRAMQQDLMQGLIDSKVAGPLLPDVFEQGNSRGGGGFRQRLLRPIYQDDAKVMLRQMGRLIDALEADDWPEYDNRLSPPLPELQGSPWRHPLAQTLLPSVARAPKTAYRLLNDRRLAATALSIRWYSVEHDGKLPASLQELVPKYLPHVPMDALAGNDKVIGYVNDSDNPRIYHVGENGKDDGGIEPDPKASARDNRDTDVVVHLKRRATQGSDE